MNLRQQRAENQRAIAEGKFISKVLGSIGNDINQAVGKGVSEFSSSFWAERKMTVLGGNTLEYRHLKQHRFVDMKTRNTATGRIRKKSHSIHNRIVYGHLRELIRELSFGFTDAVVAEMQQLED